MITYKEAFSRMEIAYLKGEVNAFDAKFCFCGNLENQTLHWIGKKVGRSDCYLVNYGDSKAMVLPSLATNYTAEEYTKLESVYMAPLHDFFYKIRVLSDMSDWIRMYNNGTEINQEYEDANFLGFCNGLDLLADIHKSRGEDIDLSLKLVKKQPVLA